MCLSYYYYYVGDVLTSMSKDLSPPTVASFTKEVNSILARRPLVFHGRLTYRGLTSLAKGATGGCATYSRYDQ